MGSAIVYHLAVRGLHVLGLEQFDIPHTQGSSHGLSRIIRQAYFESPSYVPVLRRAYALWRELEAESGEALLTITGGLHIGTAESNLLKGALASVRRHGLEHEVLDAAELVRQYPALRVPADMKAVYEPEAGYLRPERCITAHVAAAQARGAEIRAREPLLHWEPDGDGVRVTTTRGVYRADRLVVSAGAWATKVLPSLKLPLQPERQVLGWFQPATPALFAAGRLPVWLLETVMAFVIALGFDISGSFDSNFEFFAAILLFIAVANLAGVVPSVSGGLGPFEFFGAVSLVAMGVADAEAGAFVLTVHIALLVPVTIAGGIVLFMDGTSLRSLFSGARAAPMEGEAPGAADAPEASP